MKIGLLDHMGYGNMGDAAVHEAFVKNITERLPDVHLIAFSQNPQDTITRHRIDTYPINRDPSRNGKRGPQQVRCDRQSTKETTGTLLHKLTQPIRILQSVGDRIHTLLCEVQHLRRTYTVVQTLDVLVIAGGGQLCDLWWLQPYNIFKFCFLSRLSKTPVFIVGVGADLIRGTSSKLFARLAVQLASYTSFRDRESQALIQSLGVKVETRICPDPAYALDVRSSTILATSSAIKGRIGINPMGYCDPRMWPRKDTAIYDQYIDKLSQFSLWLLRHNYSIELFTSDIGVDKYAMEDLKERILAESVNTISDIFSSRAALELPELLEQMSSFDFVVTSKFHGVVFSHLLEKPVIALSYLPKINYLMRTVGHEQYCINLDDFDLPRLIDMFSSLTDDRDNLKTLFRQTSKRYAADLSAEFDNFAQEVLRNTGL